MDVLSLTRMMEDLIIDEEMLVCAGTRVHVWEVQQSYTHILFPFEPSRFLLPPQPSPHSMTCGYMYTPTHKDTSQNADQDRVGGGVCVGDLFAFTSLRGVRVIRE